MLIDVRCEVKQTESLHLNVTRKDCGKCVKTLSYEK